MQHLTTSAVFRTLAPYSLEIKAGAPRRKSLDVPLYQNNAFVKPLRQDFVKNARMMPMTRCMIALLVGWAGREQAIETTIGIIAKHIGRSVSQVRRYLEDAIEEGYLYYSRTKDRIGRYTGIKIHLNFVALKPAETKRKKQKSTERLGMSLVADTNKKYINKGIQSPQERAYLEKLGAILKRNGLPPTLN